MFVLEKHHRVVAPNRGAQQPRGVGGGRRKRDADARAMREDAFARLAVVRTAALEIAADRHAHDHRTRIVVARAIAQHRHLVADLHHRGPDVIEELDLDNRLQPADGHADGAADDRGFGDRRVEHAIVAELPLQPMRHLEDTALAIHRLQRVVAAGIGDVFAKYDDAGVARHFVSERAIDQADHGVGLALGMRGRVERRRRRIDVRRIHPLCRRASRGLRRLRAPSRPPPRSRRRLRRAWLPGRRRWRCRWQRGTRPSA